MKENSNMEPIYTITGTVVHGRGIGKHVGTPTANIEADEHVTLPETGVYVAKILEQVATDRLSARKFWGLKQTNCTLYIDVKRHCVTIGEEEVYLSAKEFDVFYMLYLSPQTTFTKEQIYEKIWHEPTNNHLHAVENTIFQIRKRLKPHCKGHEYIKTVIGYGYKFNSD